MAIALHLIVTDRIPIILMYLDIKRNGSIKIIIVLISIILSVKRSIKILNKKYKILMMI